MIKYDHISSILHVGAAIGAGMFFMSIYALIIFYLIIHLFYYLI